MTGSSSCQCTTTLHGKKKDTILRQLRIMLTNSLSVIGLSWELGSEETWYGTYTDKPDGSWDRMAEELMAIFSGSGHPIFRASSALKEENHEAKEGARSLFTSMVVMKASSCFSARWFLRISSVSTKPWQIYATKYPKVWGLRGNLKHLIIWKR